MDKNNYLLGLYEKALEPNLTLKEKLETAYRLGFDFMELSIDETQEKLDRVSNPNFLKEIIEANLTSKIRFESICLSGQRKYPLGSLDISTREKSISLAFAAIKLASSIGIRHIQLAGYDVYYETSTSETKSYFLKGLKDVVNYAAKYGILLGFETMENSFMNTISKAMEIVKIIDSPYLGVYPDIGNLTNGYLKENIDPVSDILSGKGHIIASHLKETKPGVYRNLLFGQGHTNYALFLKEYKKMGVSRFLMECWYNSNDDHFLSNLERANVSLRQIIKEIYNE
jgi:predicted hexulose-6-phosphate isomerase